MNNETQVHLRNFIQEQEILEWVIMEPSRSLLVMKLQGWAMTAIDSKNDVISTNPNVSIFKSDYTNLY